ncbi:MAG: hypothetical protein JW900_05775 [Anaerolineae bacterium]|nr:hypothetical protein [Anaerolineae bacterium]
MYSYTVRDWVTVGLFGALWGAVELTLGSVLHLLFPPQADTFLAGLVLGGVGVAIALTGRHFVPRRGSVLLIGIVAALIKLLSPTDAQDLARVLGPFLAILVESLLMEGVLLLVRTPRLWAFIVGGALAVGWNLPHKFVMMRLFYGRGFDQVYQKMVEDGAQMLGVGLAAALLILAILLIARLVVGGIGGWGAWALGGAVARRIARRGPAAD